jgi:hypothetical protein
VMVRAFVFVVLLLTCFESTHAFRCGMQPSVLRSVSVLLNRGSRISTKLAHFAVPFGAEQQHNPAGIPTFSVASLINGPVADTNKFKLAIARALGYESQMDNLMKVRFGHRIPCH